LKASHVDPDLNGLLLLATDTAKRAAENVLKDPPIIKEVRLDLDKDIKLEADYKLEKFIIDNIAQQSGYPCSQRNAVCEWKWSQ